MSILENNGIKFVNCQHHIHKSCLSDNFSDDHVNKCKACSKPILDGLEAALKIPKMKPNKVTRVIEKKKQQ